MTLRVATVLSAREWESELVAEARRTAAVRLVLRAYQPEDVKSRIDAIDVVVAGGETSWVTPAQIATWRRNGLRVVGVYPAGDLPARDLLASGGADEVISDDQPSAGMLQTIRFLAPGSDIMTPEQSGRSVAVAGGRGAPGRTEIALALAWNWARAHRTLLVDLDLTAPALAIRLGRPPRPDITDAADAVRSSGEIPADALQTHGPVSIIVGSHRPGEPPLRTALAEDLIEAATGRFGLVVMDLGDAAPDDRLLKRADEAVLVVEASPVGLVRGARMAAEWSGPPPALVVNRVPRGERAQVLEAARRWTGLEPAVMVPELHRVPAASRAARPPDGRLRRALSALTVPA